MGRSDATVSERMTLDLCILGRAYGNLAMGLASLQHPRSDEGLWEGALLAAMKSMDGRLYQELTHALSIHSPSTGGALALVPSFLESFKHTSHLPVPARYAGHAGMAVHVPSAWGERSIPTQAEIAASLAWAEHERRQTRHHVQAAKAARERHNLLRQSLLPTIRDRLEAAKHQEEILLLTLAWVGLRDLGVIVKP